MSKILEYFKRITQIPHCSNDTTQLRDYLIEFATHRGYSVVVDDAHNILISKAHPKIALQAHYDMVCVGKAPLIETYEEEGWLKAKDASLGADNGVAIAMMMELMDRGVACEFLLTNDEEIGLVGAKAVAFELQSHCMLNLDSEEEGEVCIGCAGGEDIVATQTFEALHSVDDSIYEVGVYGLSGGHSGVDIDKGIPNAIKVLVEYLKANDVQILSFEGGERRNSIPVNAKALVYAPHALPPCDKVTIRKGNRSSNLTQNNLLELLDTLPHGVLEYNSELDIPQSSVNLALVAFVDNQATLTLTTRGMSNQALALASGGVVELLNRYGFEVKKEEGYPAWNSITNDFTQLVHSAMKEEFGDSALVAIHAGLECGVLLSQYPHIAFASIGPTIASPHSTSEKLKIDSIEKSFRVVCKIIECLQ
ncbi:MAG: aminoacyl-histidine dipeptidase [Sulfurovum sp. FS08-3]|nr:MAG: aminoacyl-histidine dipeptidase [Sulfurovum sp. FS08-3]